MALFFPNRTSLEKEIIDTKWWGAYSRIVQAAMQLAQERSEQYNATGSMPDYFPTPRDLLHEIDVCTKRIESKMAAGINPGDSIADLINYTAYLGALLEIEWWNMDATE